MRRDISWLCEHNDPGEPTSQPSIDGWKDWARTDRATFVNRVRVMMHRARLATYDDDRLQRWRKRIAAWAYTRAPRHPSIQRARARARRDLR
eukprot:1818015-Pyramimonas_sp.AAC.1